jgi:uncharacterized protein YjbI with pentapeptide repeats
VFLYESHLVGVNAQNANFDEASLWDANLTHSFLVGATFEGANLSGADLSGADLAEANLSGARNLTQVQIDHADGDENTTLPDSLTRPAHWNTNGWEEHED